MRDDPRCTCAENLEEPHSCPYAEEIGDVSPDDETEWCTCCPHCSQECADDI